MAKKGGKKKGKKGKAVAGPEPVTTRYVCAFLPAHMQY